jgi:two-component system, LytTR family, sensor kinase
MSFKKVEFWLATLVAVFFTALLTYLFIEDTYKPYLAVNEAPAIAFVLRYLGVKLLLVLAVYGTFLFLNHFVFTSLFNKKKYDLVAIALFTAIAFLYGFLLWAQSNFPDVLSGQTFRSNDHLAILSMCITIYLLYTGFKKLGFYLLEAYVVKNAVRIKIARQALVAAIIWFMGLVVILAGVNRSMSVILLPTWGLWLPCAFTLIMISVYKFLPEHSRQQKPVSFYLLKVGITSAILSFFFSITFVNGMQGLFFFWLSQVLVSTPVAWLLYMHNKENIHEMLQLKQALGRTTADLQFLRSQINPHFLFNALNTLYGTALQENSNRTAEGVQKLGDMMRFMLHENMQPEISLDKEAEYLRNYIDLQLLRIEASENIEIKTEINETDCNHTIAPMLLIPFVENAFKHGISLKHKSWIKISLHCDAESLYLDVYNSLHDRTAPDTEKDSHGIGLENVKQRLALLYPGTHKLNIHKTAREFIVHLTVKLTSVPLRAEKKEEIAIEEEEVVQLT